MLGRRPSKARAQALHTAIQQTENAQRDVLAGAQLWKDLRWKIPRVCSSPEDVDALIAEFVERAKIDLLVEETRLDVIQKLEQMRVILRAKFEGGER